MKQELEFLAPVRIGDTVTARAEVVEVVKEKNRVKLRTTCVKQDGTTVVDGEALVSPPKAPKRSG
jgi:3-hydroxybutyryl-CoA dehydratase